MLARVRQQGQPPLNIRHQTTPFKCNGIRFFHLHWIWSRRAREFFIDNLLVRIHLIIVMIRWTGLAPWEFEFPFPDSLTSTFIFPNLKHQRRCQARCRPNSICAGSAGGTAPCNLVLTPSPTPTPYTLHPTPYTIHPTPCTLHPTSYTLHPTPYTLHPLREVLTPDPDTPHPTPYTLRPLNPAGGTAPKLISTCI